MQGEPEHGLAGLAVVSFESRRAQEMANLIRRYGGTPVVAPSMREVPLSENTAALEFLRDLEAGEVDVFIVLTGVGLRALLATLEPVCGRERLAELLRRTMRVARGPKSAAPLREMGLRVDVTVPEPNTWREVLKAIDAHGPVTGATVAVQEYGMRNAELLSGLEARGAQVRPVPVYRWALPEDIAPLREAVKRLADGTADVALFTSATQVDHVMRVADEIRSAAALRAAAGRLVIGSVGPICSEQLMRLGLAVDIEPEHAKMGQLVQAVARQAKEVLVGKRAPG